VKMPLTSDQLRQLMDQTKGNTMQIDIDDGKKNHVNIRLVEYLRDELGFDSNEQCKEYLERIDADEYREIIKNSIMRSLDDMKNDVGADDMGLLSNAIERTRDLLGYL